MTAIKHIEFLVSDFAKSMHFYAGLFAIIKWEPSGENGFKAGGTKIYLTENCNLSMQSTLGPRHICFLAVDSTMVDRVGAYLAEYSARIIRGPEEAVGDKYSKGYYAVDFYDPDGYILEVAYSPVSK